MKKERRTPRPRTRVRRIKRRTAQAKHGNFYQPRFGDGNRGIKENFRALFRAKNQPRVLRRIALRCSGCDEVGGFGMNTLAGRFFFCVVRVIRVSVYFVLNHYFRQPGNSVNSVH